MRVLDGLDPHKQLIDFLINRNSCPKSHWGAYSDPTDPLSRYQAAINSRRGRERGERGEKTIVVYLVPFSRYSELFVEIRRLTYPSAFCTPTGDDLDEFRRHLWHRKTRFPGLLCSIVCVLAV